MRVNTYILCFQLNELYWHGTLYVLPKHNRNDEKYTHRKCVHPFISHFYSHYDTRAFVYSHRIYT